MKAVDGVDLEVPESSTVCIVGESGSGKSVTAHSILQLVDRPGRIEEGEILYRYADGTEVNLVKLKQNGKEMRSVRGKEISMIFQEPMSSLGPVHKIGNQLVQAIRLHTGLKKDDAYERGVLFLEKVGIPNARDRMEAYSFELSGGMRQRVMIAMALCCEARLLIADEPTTALDVTTQANILNLIKSLQQSMKMSVMFITHDLGVVAKIADYVAVMYLGQVVESGTVFQIFDNPLHPYTQALMQSIPRISFCANERLSSIRGMVPHPFSRPVGCGFSDRCEFVDEKLKCETTPPSLLEVEAGHFVRCYRTEVFS
ncbi:MAG: ABC transporter ATP-binding protein [Christensenellales bacterium]